MSFVILILLNGKVVEQHPVGTLQSCIEMTREVNDDGTKQAACSIRTSQPKNAKK
jgi:hypothetical protein